MTESVPIIDCDICLELLKYLNEHKECVELRKLDGFMRTKRVTTTIYHLKRHLKPKDLVTILEKGTFRKMEYVKITESGVKALSKTFNKE